MQDNNNYCLCKSQEIRFLHLFGNGLECPLGNNVEIKNNDC